MEDIHEISEAIEEDENSDIRIMFKIENILSKIKFKGDLKVKQMESMLAIYRMQMYS